MADTTTTAAATRGAAAGGGFVRAIVALLGLLLLVSALPAAADDAAAAPGRRPVMVTEQRVERLAAAFERQAGRRPSAAELDGLIAAWVRDEILLREAIARGLDRDLVLVRYALDRERHDGGGHADDDAGVDRALTRGLDRDDPNVRTYLIEKMRRLLLAEGGPIELTESELRDAFADRREHYRRPARVAFTHVFLGRDHRGERLRADARALLGELARERPRPRRAATRGDLFLGPAMVPSATPAGIERIFGPRFAAALEVCPARAWCGPIPSAYGLHLVWVEERRPARRARFAEARVELERELRETHRETRLATAVDRLARGYRIETRHGSECPSP